MVIITIILALLVAGLLVRDALRNYAVKETIRDTYENLPDNVYPCKLILTVNFNKPDYSTITDFSKYEKEGLVGLTINQTRPATTHKEIAIDGQPTYFSVAAVFQIEGYWFWKVL